MSKIVHLHVRSPAGAWVPVAGDSAGTLGRSPGQQDWSYAAASGGIADTSDVTLAAAPGAGKVNYLTSIQLQNADATVDTEVVVKSGSTVLFRTWLPPGNPAALTGTMPVQINFPQPLRADNNTALTAACITTSAMVYINAQGFIDQSVAQLAAGVSNVVELFDAGGNVLTDAAGNPLIQGYP